MKTIKLFRGFIIGAAFLAAASPALAYEQVCTCDGNASSTSDIMTAYRQAVLTCTCVKPGIGEFDPPACPAGLMQIGPFVKRNCTPTGSLAKYDTVTESCYLPPQGSGQNASCQVTCEIVRVCGNALGN